MTDPKFEPGGMFYDRGIREEVADPEHFFAYGHDDCDGHRADWQDWPCWIEVSEVGDRGARYIDLPQSQQRTIAYRAMQAPGTLFIRHSVKGEDPILPEMRPDWPVLTGKITWHAHDDATVAESPEWQRHVAKIKVGRGGIIGMAALVDWVTTRYPAKVPMLLSKSGNPMIVSHDGENLEGWHGHRRVAKYLFSAQPIETLPWSHTHETDFPKRAHAGSQRKADRAKADHVAEDHTRRRTVKGPVNVTVVEVVVPDAFKDEISALRARLLRRKVKDLAAYRVRLAEIIETTKHSHEATEKDETVPLAARLDIHGKAQERLDKYDGTDGWELWIAMESCLKSGAILQAIIDEDRPATVVSFPSVTLWPPELEKFVSHLRGRFTVYVVPDSDYRHIQQVRSQAFFAREKLRAALGAENVHIAAPPPEGYEADGTPIKSGADDALGKYRRTLDEFEVIDRDPPLGFAELKWQRTERKKVGDWRVGDTAQAAIYRWLVLCADEDGVTRMGSSTIARHAFPEQWDAAEAADLAAGHDARTGRASETERDKVRSRVRQNLRAMERDHMIEIVGRDVVLDGDGNPIEVNGVAAVYTVRRIPADIWQRFKGDIRTVAEHRDGADLRTA